MHLAALVVVFSTLVVEPCLAGLTVQKHDPDRSSLIEASIDILESCYAHRFSDVGLAGPAAGSIMKTMTMRNTVLSVTLVDETSVANVDPMDDANRHKLQVFAITVTDSSNLVKTLVRVKYSKWWNHMASFILIDKSATSHGCSNAYENLWQAWKMNLLNAKFMCVDETRGTLIYTFNPYTNKAPIPWRQENTHKGINGHPWTLFAMEYRDEKSHCHELDYDKTLDLGGYEICAGCMKSDEWLEYADENLPILTQVKGVKFDFLRDSLNATWKPLFPLDNIGHGEIARYDYLAREITNGNCDVIVEIVGQWNANNHKLSYPHHEFGLSIITHYRGSKSQLEKIISVLDRPSRYCVIIVLLITLLFFKFCLRKSTTTSILIVVLVTCNAALGKMPKQLASRIYLGSLFVFVITVHGMYSGKLATLVTGNVRMRNIDSMEDLARSDHNVYADEFYGFFVNSSTFEGRFFLVADDACADSAEYDRNAACITVTHQALDLAERSGRLHVSSESIVTFSGVYVIRTDWPLEKRANDIFAIASTSGIAKFSTNNVAESRTRRLKRVEYAYRHQPVKIITFEQLTFAFVILAIGLACAIVAFVIELTVNGESIANPKILMKKWYANLLKLVFR